MRDRERERERRREGGREIQPSNQVKVCRVQSKCPSFAVLISQTVMIVDYFPLFARCASIDTTCTTLMFSSCDPSS